MALEADKEILVNIKYQVTGQEAAVQSEQQLKQAIASDMTSLQGMLSDQAKGMQVNGDQMSAVSARLTANVKQYQDSYAQASVANTAATKGLNTELDKTNVSFRDIRYGLRGLEQVGMLMTAAGAGLTAAFVLPANEFVKTMGYADATSAQFLETQNQIKTSEFEIGQTAAQVMLPALKAGADIMDRVAQVVQSNPWIVQAALGVGTVLTVVGAITAIVSKLILAAAEIHEAIASGILTKIGIGAVGAEAGTAATAGEAGAAGAGTGAAAAAGVPVLPILAGLGLQLGLLAGETRVSIAGFEGLLTAIEKIDPAAQTGIEAFRKWYNEMVNAAHNLPIIGGLFPEMGGGAPSPSTAEGATVLGQNVPVGVSPEQYMQGMKEFDNYQKQITDAQARYDDQRLQITNQYGQQVADATASYESQRAQVITNYEDQVAKTERDFALQQQKAAEQYALQRQQSISQYNLQEKNRAQQHAEEMATLTTNFNRKLEDDAANRDAYAMVKDQQNYQDQVQQKNEQYKDQQSQAKSELDLRLKDDAQRYALERKYAQIEEQNRLADMAQAEQDRLAQMDAQHVLEMQKMAQQEQDKLAALDQNYQKEVDTLKTAFTDRLNAINPIILGDQAQFENAMKAQASAFASWISNYEQNVSNTPLFSAATAGQTTSGTIGEGSTAGGYGSPTTPGAGSIYTYNPATGTYGWSGGGGSGSTRTRAYQEGGYAPFGLYKLGDAPSGGPGGTEFVMNAATTRKAEQMMGGALTQESILNAMLASRMGTTGLRGGSVNVSVQSRSLSLAEVRDEINLAVDMKLGELLPAFGGQR